MGEVKRVFVGGLVPEITEKELTERFQRFGDVVDIQIKNKRDWLGAPEKTFAYLNMKSTPENLQKCFSLYNKTKWKGSELKIQLAKENFLTRLEMERKTVSDGCEKKLLKDNVKYHNPFENLPDPSIPEWKGCVPGTQVPGEKNWVVGKYGRVLPVVYVKNKEKKKIIKVDPSKFCHNLKRIKEDETDYSLVSSNNNLTLQLEESNSDIIKKQKGEFPEWKPSSKKRKNVDFDKLRELYLNNNNESKPMIDAGPSFEIVSEDLIVSHVPYDSNESDSDSFYDSLKCKKLDHSSKKSKMNEEGGQNMSASAKNSLNRKLTDPSLFKSTCAERKDSGENTAFAKEKPKMKPFGGTKHLYENVISTREENFSNLHSTCKNSVASENHLNPERSSKKSVNVSKSVQMKGGNSIQEKLNNSKLFGDEDGHMSTSSADTDEIVNRSSSRPTNELAFDFHNCFAITVKKAKKSKIAMSSHLNLSIVDEYSSGLISGELPYDNESSYSSAEDSDESDFEKFVLKESQKAKQMLKNEKSNIKNSLPENIKKKTQEKLFEDSSVESLFDSCESEVEITRSDIECLKSKKSHKTKQEKDIKVTLNDMSYDITKNKKETLDLDKLPGKIDSFDKGNLSTMSLVDSDESPQDITEVDVQNVNDSITSDSDDNSYTGGSDDIEENNVSKSSKVTHPSDVEKNKLNKENMKFKEKKPEIDTNKKRLESIKQRQMENKAQKSAIQKALANIDGTVSANKKIIFNDSDEDDCIGMMSNNVDINKHQPDDKDLSGEDPCDLIPDSSYGVNKKDTNVKKKKSQALFDSSDSAESSDEDMFKIRPEFEGKSGQKRMELQSRYGNDDRFKLDERFIDSEDNSDNDNKETEELEENDERMKSIRILEEVVGIKINKEKKGKMFRDISALHFDPTREDHSQFEVKENERPKKDRKVTKKRKELDPKDEEKIEELPLVGKEKFFEVSDSLKGAFSQAEEPQGFSLLSAFSSIGDDCFDSDKDQKDNTEFKELKHKSSVFPWQHQYDDEDSDSDRMESDNEMDAKSDIEEGKLKEPIVFTTKKPFFFFQENDDRIDDGVKNFYRQESLEEVRERWLEKRSFLVEAYRAKHKRLVRKMKLDKKHSHKPVFNKQHRN